MTVRIIPVRLMVVLGALSAFGPLSMDLYLPALPALARDLHTTDALAQLTMSSCMVGLAVGQLLLGPVSDRYGRRLPLLAGVTAYAISSLLCALAPDVAVLAGLRLVQGLAGGAGIVIARAVVRDLYDTDRAAHVFSLLMVVTGLAPVIAPVLGGQILRVTAWPGLFVTLAGIGVLLLAATAGVIRETRPAVVETPGRFSGGRRFAGFTAVLALGSGALFIYISMSPFVLQHGYGLSPQQFSLVFAANSLGLLAASRLGTRLIRRRGVRWTLRAGVLGGAAFGWVLLGVVAAGATLPVVLIMLWCAVSCVALIMPSATALALADHGARAGTASGVIGVAQFGFGAAIAPLVTLAGTTATVMAAGMASAAAAAAVVDRLLDHRSPVRQEVSKT